MYSFKVTRLNEIPKEVHVDEKMKHEDTCTGGYSNVEVDAGEGRNSLYCDGAASEV